MVNDLVGIPTKSPWTLDPTLSWEVSMRWSEAVVEVLCILQAMLKWMAGMVLIRAILPSKGYAIGKLTGG
jgi:hypothetical protein